MFAIKTIGLVKKYKDITAVDRLDLEIRQGELFSLLGVNGAGKTTLIKMLSCLLRPTSGDAEIMGYSIISRAQEVKKLPADTGSSGWLANANARFTTQTDYNTRLEVAQWIRTMLTSS